MKYNLFAVLAIIVLAILFVVVIYNRNAANTMIVEAESAQNVEGRKAVLVELFTSEGCSSCPPADDLLIHLEKTRPIEGVEIIALSQHVDYWNRLGWADPFSSPEFSSRQNRYASVFRNDSIYTPQMVVDGHLEMVGSNSGKVQSAIRQAVQHPKAKIQVSQTESKASSEKITIQLSIHIEDLPTISAGDRIDVMLAITESGLLSNVSRGENAGRRIAHTAVVRKLNHIASIDSAKGGFDKIVTAEIEKGWSRDNLRAVVFVQERHSMRVRGAAAVSLAVKP